MLKIYKRKKDSAECLGSRRETEKKPRNIDRYSAETETQGKPGIFRALVGAETGVGWG